MTASPDTATLVGWLQKQIEITERIARKATTQGAWDHDLFDEGEAWVVLPDGEDWDGETFVATTRPGVEGRDNASHIALHDPQAVLADVEAKRRIAELHEGSHECSSFNHMTGDYDNCTWVPGGVECSTLRLLASAYRHRPGWQESWRP